MLIKYILLWLAVGCMVLSSLPSGWCVVLCKYCGHSNADARTLCGSCSSLLPKSNKGLQGVMGRHGSSGKNAPKKIRTISKNGKAVDIDENLVPGAVTIVDFYADWCGPCKSLDPHIKKLVHKNDNVYLRKINIMSWQSPVAEQYSIRSIPSIWVYDGEGKLVGERLNGYQNIKNAVDRAKG